MASRATGADGAGGPATAAATDGVDTVTITATRGPPAAAVAMRKCAMPTQLPHQPPSLRKMGAKPAATPRRQTCATKQAGNILILLRKSLPPRIVIATDAVGVVDAVVIVAEEADMAIAGVPRTMAADQVEVVAVSRFHFPLVVEVDQDVDGKGEEEHLISTP